MKYRVLCIEDDEVDRHLLQRRIDRIDTDIEPVFVDTLEAAFSETEALCPDLVLLDWHLLDGDGDDYLEFVSGKYPWLPVIILTSEPDELASSTLQTGAQDFLTKGKFDDAQFERAITYSLLRARSRGLKHLEHEAKKREPIQRYASKFVSDVRQPTRALATKLDRLVDAINSDEPIHIDPMLLQRAVFEIRDHLDEILTVARDLTKQARDGHFEQPPQMNGELLELPVEKQPAEPASPFDVGRRLSILIIDNEHYMRLMFKRLLGPEHDLFFASTVTDASNQIAENGVDFDGILCNFVKLDQQAEMLEKTLEHSSFELSRRVVLFAAGEPGASFQAFLDRAGARLLPKPFELEQLRSALLHWASFHEARTTRHA